MDFNSIGSNIKKYRLARGLRQEDLAEKAGVSPNYIGLIERGQKVPALDTFIVILNVLEASADIVLAEVLKNGYKVKNSLLNEPMSKMSEENRNQAGVVAHAFNSSTWEAEADGFLSLRPAWYTK